MHQVFFRFANKDEGVARPLIDAVHRAGFGVLEPGMLSPDEPDVQRKIDQIATAECVVAFWSAAAAASKFMQAEMRHVLKAWSLNRLVLVMVDEEQLPVGLRDLPVIALRGSPEAHEKELIERICAVICGVAEQVRHDRERMELTAIAQSSRNKQAWEELYPPPAGTLKRGTFRWIIAFGVAALLVFFTATLWHLTDALWFARQPLPYINYMLMALIVGAAIGGLVVWAWTISSRRSKLGSQPLIAAQHSVRAEAGTQQIFVSYSRQDQSRVDRIVEEIVKLRYTVWIDRQSSGSQRYAGPIVQAIRTSQIVALMCSADAFKSDHVIREVYVAGENKKPFITFLLDQTEFPDDILYFVSGFPRIPIRSLQADQLRSEIARLIARDDSRASNPAYS
jgi:hypothetical protein